MIGWVIVAFIIFSVIRRKGHRPTSQSSMNRLKERFVNGEMDEATYRNMKTVIEQ